MTLPQLALSFLPFLLQQGNVEGFPEARFDIRGDPLPQGAVARLGSMRFREGFHHEINSMAFSPSGRVLATALTLGFVGSNSRAARSAPPPFAPISLWDIPSGKKIRQLEGHPYQTNDLCFSPAGDLLASGGGDSIRLWDTTSWEAVGFFKLEVNENAGEREFAVSLTFVPNQSYLLVSSSHGRVFLWDYKSQKVLHDFPKEQSSPNFAVSASGKFLAMAAPEDSIIYLWNTKSLTLTKALKVNVSSIYSLVFSKDEKYLFSGGEDKKVWKWSLSADEENKAVTQHSAPVRFLALDAKGETLVSGDAEGNLAFFPANKRNFALPKMNLNNRGAKGLRFSPDGKYLACGTTEGLIRLWEWPTGKEIGADVGHRANVRQVLFLKQGEELVSHAFDYTMWRWNAYTGQPIKTLQLGLGSEGDVWNIAISPEGKQICSSHFDNTIRLWDVESFQQLSKKPMPNAIYRLHWSPSSSQIALGENNDILVFDEPNGKLLKKISVTKRGALALSAQLLAYSDAKREKSILVLDTRDWSIKAEFAVFRRDLGINFIQISSSERLLAAGRRGMIYLWDLNKRELISNMMDLNAGSFESISFSPDGRMLVAGLSDSQVVVWESYTGKKICSLKGHAGSVDTVQFSPKRGFLASGSMDQTILVWDMGLLFRQMSAVKNVKDSIEDLWRQLSNPEPSIAYQAVWQMVAIKDNSVLFLKQQLKPVIAPSAKAREDLLDDLHGDSFRKREAAERELRKVVELCEKDLLKEKETAKSLEYLTRIEAILKTNVISDPQRLQQLRALAVLEYIGTPEALSIIEALAGGGEGSIITLEARESKQRVNEARKPRK
jgi:WD40 repeat protein